MVGFAQGGTSESRESKCWVARPENRFESMFEPTLQLLRLDQGGPIDNVRTDTMESQGSPKELHIQLSLEQQAFPLLRTFPLRRNEA